MADSKLTEEHAPNAENQGYSTTQYSVNQGNWQQEHQGYNIGYQNDSSQGHASNNVQFVENHGYQTTQGSNNGSAQNDVQPAASQGYQNAQQDQGNYYFHIYTYCTSVNTILILIQNL